MRVKLVLTLLALTGFELKLSAADLPAALPGFMDQGELVKWRADKASTEVRTRSGEASAPFYTGKPYVADAGGYVFNYRTYNPEISRWTSVDPSGFPDGANNCAYAPVPTSQLDPNGLITVNGQTWVQGAEVDGLLSSTLSWAFFAGGSSAGADGSRFPNTDNSAYGNIILLSRIAGYSNPLSDRESVTLLPFFRISIIPNEGLTFDPIGEFQNNDNGVVGSIINYSYSGQGTRTLTIRLTVDYALNATSITGGVNAGTGGVSGSASFAGTPHTRSFAFGTFVFQE